MIPGYSINEIPFTLNFSELSKRELREYFEWFMNAIPERTSHLANVVQLTAGYDDWNPAETPESLDRLGAWFAEHVTTRKRNPEEIEHIRQQMPFPIDIPDWDLALETLSLTVDIGMYLGQTFVESYPSLKWEQVLGNKKYADYGQAVVTGFGRTELNPLRVVQSIACVIVDESHPSHEAGAEELKRTYRVWEEYIPK
jgi:hypothetical protein